MDQFCFHFFSGRDGGSRYGSSRDSRDSYGGRGGGGGFSGGGFRGSMKGSQPGERLRKPKWDMSTLQKFEKNFYKEHPNVASRHQVKAFFS